MLRILPLLLVVAALTSAAAAPRCDRLLVGGTVHLADGPRRVEIAVAEGRIVALVPPAEAGPWRSAAGEVVDFAGAHVYPGFTEGHGHFVGYGAALEQVDLVGTTSYAEVVERVKAAAAGRPAGAWVVGRGWDQNDWADKALPVHGPLSAALPDRPVLLRRVDGHAVLLNAAAMVAAGITASSPDREGGRIVRDTAGAPTGVLVDAAADLVERALPRPTAADVERRAILAGRTLASFGLTSIHDAGTSREELAVLRVLERQGRLPVRVWSMLDGGDDDLLAAELGNGPWTSPGGMLTVRAVKLYADGALGSRGALLSAPYSDEPGSRGLAVTTPERLAEVVRRAARAGFQPCVHAIGDAAVTRVLDVYEQVLGAGSTLRPRIEHAQIVRPEDVPRFARLGVVAAVQPTHCTSDMPWAPRRLGAERIAWAYRWRSLLAAGARLELGSDVPVESPDPRAGMWAAVTRRPPEGTDEPGWNLPEALTRAEAVAGFTAWPAWAGFEEGWRGTIAPAYAADFSVFDRSLEEGEPATILQARVVRTIVAGRDAFVAGGAR